MIYAIVEDDCLITRQISDMYILTTYETDTSDSCVSEVKSNVKVIHTHSIKQVKSQVLEYHF